MKRVIDGRIYDTAVAEPVHRWDNGRLDDDLHFEEAILYRTPKGAYFVCGAGGPLTDYAERVDSSTMTAGIDLWAVDKDQAIEWLENRGGHEALVDLFVERLEDA